MGDACPDLSARWSSGLFRGPVQQAAKALLGSFLVHETGGQRLVVRIVETEAYLGQKDPAAHSFGGRRTARNEVMYSAGGLAYVYLIYGLHHCLNLVTGEPGTPAAVLFRAAEPVEGQEVMLANRGLGREPKPGDLCGGPGKLCQALGVSREFNGHDLRAAPLWLAPGRCPASELEISRGPRVGVDYAGEAAQWPLRFALAGNPHVSRPRL